jgi:hypothetical protein
MRVLSSHQISIGSGPETPARDPCTSVQLGSRGITMLGHRQVQGAHVSPIHANLGRHFSNDAFIESSLVQRVGQNGAGNHLTTKACAKVD